MEGNGPDVLLFRDLAAVDDVGYDIWIKFLQLRGRGCVEILDIQLKVLEWEVDCLVPLFFFVFTFFGEHEVEETQLV